MESKGQAGLIGMFGAEFQTGAGKKANSKTQLKHFKRLITYLPTASVKHHSITRGILIALTVLLPLPFSLPVSKEKVQLLVLVHKIHGHR